MEMTFQDFIKERNRMCDSFDIECRNKNESCGFSRTDDCNVYILNNPKEAEKVVKEWSEEHPVETNEQHYINMMKKEFGVGVSTENCCPPKQHGIVCDSDSNCDTCRKWWNQEYKVPESEG